MLGVTLVLSGHGANAARRRMMELLTAEERSDRMRPLIHLTLTLMVMPPLMRFPRERT